MFGRKDKPQAKKITKEQILAEWNDLQEKTTFLYSDQFNGIDADTKLALANTLLERFLSRLHDYLHA